MATQGVAAPTVLQQRDLANLKAALAAAAQLAQELDLAAQAGRDVTAERLRLQSLQTQGLAFLSTYFPGLT